MKATVLTGKHAKREVEIVKEYPDKDHPRFLVAIEVDGKPYKFTYPKRALRFDYEVEEERQREEERQNGVELLDPLAPYRMYGRCHLATFNPVTEDEVRSAFHRRYGRNPAQVVKVTGRWWAGPLTQREVQA